MTSIFNYNKTFELESGEILPGFHLAYTTHGELEHEKNNVIWIFHALTANSDPAEWWPGIVGDGKYFDPAKYFIICVNKPGSPYGSISPLSIKPETNKPYHLDFPVFSIRDMIRAYILLKDSLGIKNIFIGLGGSTGGMQLLEWAIQEPDLFQHIVPIATNAVLSPWGIAFNASQRMAIEADPTWTQLLPGAGNKGLETARSIAMLSYRHYNGYSLTQRRDKAFVPLTDQTNFAAENYQRYQGLKLSKRFNVVCYYRLTQSMDSHDIGRNRNGVVDALKKIRARTLVIGITSDLLYPIAEQELLQEHIPYARILKISSDFGHDGFLLEYDKIETAVRGFIEENKKHCLKIVNE